MIDPARAVDLASAMQDLYTDAEVLMLERVRKRLEGGLDRPGWAEVKLRQLQAVRDELAGVLTRLQRDGVDLLPGILAAAHAEGVRAASVLAGDLPFLPRPNLAAVQALAGARVSGLLGVHVAILRSIDDVYRQVIAEAAGVGVLGAASRREAAQLALRRFADRGVSGFVDARGRHWDLGSYVEMATRSSIAQAYLEGHLTSLLARGRDLVIVSNSPDECPRCRPWEGKVLSITGADPERPSLDEARAGGLFHASCTHTVGIYVDGLTRPMTNTSDAAGNRQRARHRELERNVRRWKRRQAAALTDGEARLAAAKVAEWQAALRSFIAATGRRRDYGRESIRDAVPRVPPRSSTPARVSSGDPIQDALDYDGISFAGVRPLNESGINTTMAAKAGDVDVVIKPEAGLDPDILRMGIRPASDIEREHAALLMRQAMGDFVDTPRMSVREVPGQGRALVLERRRNDGGSPLETPLSERISAGLFDSVIGNTDRHFGNVLVDRSGRRAHLVLIDHGLAFPVGVPTWGNMHFLRGYTLRGADVQRLRRLVRDEGAIRTQIEPLIGSSAVDEMFRRIRYMLAEGRQLLPQEFGTRPWKNS